MENTENLGTEFGLPAEFVLRCKKAHIEESKKRFNFFESIHKSVIERHVRFLSQENISIEFSEDFLSVKIGNLRFAPNAHGLEYCGDESHKYKLHTIKDLDSFGRFLIDYEANSSPK